MDPKELFARAIEQARPCVVNVHTDEFSFSTPCSEWDLKALLNHFVYELLWVPEILNGKTIEEIGGRFDGDVLGDDPAGAWQIAADEAISAVERSDLEATVHLSYADVPAGHYINEVANDVLVHGWDVGQSIKCNLIFDPTVAQTMYDFIAPNVEKYRSGGGFGDQIAVPIEASIQTKLLALEGRREERV